MHLKGAQVVTYARQTGPMEPLGTWVTGNPAFKRRSGKKGRYFPPVHMIRLTEERQTVPYV
jgi:hypothetical protein